MADDDGNGGGEMTTDTLVIREDVGTVAVLTLHRPEKMNAWGMDMSDALWLHLDGVARDPSIGACMITGSGPKAFSSGADISNDSVHKRHPSTALSKMWVDSMPIFASLLDFPKPLIAAVNGYAIGAGFLIGLCCDQIVVSTNAALALPQTSLGIMPAYGGVSRLAQWVGRGRAMNIALTGRRVLADEALAIGLATSVYEPGEFHEKALEFTTQLAALPPLAVKMVKESVREGLERGSIEGAGIGDLYRTICLQQTEDSAEAHAAWREKRDPKFRGQ